MNIPFSVNDAVKKRISVRTYDKRPVSDETKKKILSYAESVTNPFGPKARFRLIEKEAADNGEKLGTYGVIKGAGLYIGAAIEDTPCSMEALGYEFEHLILYITSLGLGTCWLGGTFNKSGFRKSMQVKENELFPAITPVGYPSDKRSIVDKLFRGSSKGDRRKDWSEIFFKNDFTTPLSREDAKEYAYPLDMLRLSPSAVNQQPWRVIYDGNVFHFFEKHSMKRNENSTVDLQRLDTGIALCHFHLAAMQSALNGRFERKDGVNVPAGMSYIISWVTE